MPHPTRPPGGSTHARVGSATAISRSSTWTRPHPSSPLAICSLAVQDGGLDEDEFLRCIIRELSRKTSSRRNELYGLLEAAPSTVTHGCVVS